MYDPDTIGLITLIIPTAAVFIVNDISMRASRHRKAC